jgi:hypothetical protein
VRLTPEGLHEKGLLLRFFTLSDVFPSLLHSNFEHDLGLGGTNHDNFLLDRELIKMINNFLFYNFWWPWSNS